MKLDGRVMSAIARPRKDGEAEVDDRGVESVHGIRQVDRERVIDIEGARRPNQHLCEVRVDAPIARLVRIGQRRSRDTGTNADVIQLGLQCAETGFDVSQALAIRELRESHAEVLIPAREPRRFVFAVITGDALLELESRNMVHQLCEDRATDRHAGFCRLGAKQPKTPNRRRYRKVLGRRLSPSRSVSCSDRRVQ